MATSVSHCGVSLVDLLKGRRGSDCGILRPNIMVDCLVYGADDGWAYVGTHEKCACTDAPVACGDDDR